jgi:hypothetical protein
MTLSGQRNGGKKRDASTAERASKLGGEGAGESGKSTAHHGGKKGQGLVQAATEAPEAEFTAQDLIAAPARLRRRLPFRCFRPLDF